MTLTQVEIAVETQVPVERTDADILLNAARIIEEFGWCQGTWTDGAGHLCLEGAVRVALGDRPNSTKFTDAFTFVRVLGRVERVVGTRPARWNDTPGRTQAQVVAALRAAAV